MRLLTIVVTCTDRKTLRPALKLCARSLTKVDQAERAAEWKQRLARAPGHVVLEKLYQGDHWTRARALAAAASKAGFSPRLWVASAGLGLQPVSNSAPPYAATFAPRHEDSVASSSQEAARWWDHLQRQQGVARLADLAGLGPVLLVLSEVYAQAMDEELGALGAVDHDVLLIGGYREIDGVVRVPADASLRYALGGTLTSLNVRMASSWLEHCTSGTLTAPQTRSAWGEWAATVARKERYARAPMTDEAVLVFIRSMKTRHPDYSRTRLLRLLRDEGLACEQKRFGNLYTSLMGN